MMLPQIIINEEIYRDKTSKKANRDGRDKTVKSKQGNKYIQRWPGTNKI